MTGPASVQFWRSLQFTGSSNPKRPVPMKSLRKLLSYSSNDIRELVVADGRRFVLDRRKFDAILKAGVKLERLEIHNPHESLILTQIPKHLKRLELDGFQRFFRPPNPGPEYYRSLVLAVAPTLETLALAGIPMQWLTNADIPMMPNLKHLKMALSTTMQPWPLSLVSSLVKYCLWHDRLTLVRCIC